jgi:hypothetical protein
VLIRDDGEGALVIGQQSHAWLSGQLARAWGNERFPAPDPREAIALGAEQHDVGWALVDLEPRLDRDRGLPRSFLQSSVEEHLAIWRAAPAHLLSQSLYAALVVSLHGRALSEHRAERTPALAAQLQPHIDAERARQARLRAALAISESAAAAIGRQMWAWDGLSLALCNGWDPFTAKDVPAAEGLVEVELRGHADGTTSLAPWPFSSAQLEVRCEARRLPARYREEEEMRRALELAEPISLTFSLRADGRSANGAGRAM